MKPVEPTIIPEGSRLIIFAKDQPPYLPLPAVVDPNGSITSEWELSEQEIQTIIMKGRIRLTVLYTKILEGQPLSPIKLEVIAPECGFGPIQ